MTYNQIEPFGEEREELRHGQIMSLHCNLNRDPKTKAEPWNAMEFMNYVEKPPEKKFSQAELERYADSIFG